MPKRDNLWETLSVKHPYHFQTKQQKDLLAKIDDINYKIIELDCEITCLVEKKKYFLKKIQEIGK